MARLVSGGLDRSNPGVMRHVMPGCRASLVGLAMPGRDPRRTAREYDQNAHRGKTGSGATHGTEARKHLHSHK